MTRRGFSLVELLVVIAVISVLAGLLLPVLEESMQAAYLVSCSSNLKQISVGCRMYNDDFLCLPITQTATAYGPVHYMDGGALLSRGFNCLGKEYLGLRSAYGTQGWKVGSRGVLECPAKTVTAVPTTLWDISYLSSSFIGNWYGCRYGHDPDHDGIPATARGLTTAQNEEAFNIFGYRGSNGWGSADQLGGPIPGKYGVYPDKAKSPSAWPLFFDSAVSHVNGRPAANSNHGGGTDPIALNVLYLDGSVATQVPDYRWRGDYAVKTTTGWPYWYLPHIRFDNLYYYP